MTLTIIITLIVVGLIITVYAILTAKDGVEDEDGFHSLEPADPADSPSLTRNDPLPAATLTLVGHSRSIIFRDSDD